MPNKVTEFLEKLDNKQRYYIFGGVLLALFLLDYLILMRPQLSALSKISPEIKLTRDELKNANDNISRMHIYKKQTENFQKQIDETNKKIKDKSELPLILERISLLADRNEIKIDKISPNSAAQQEILKVKDGKYYALPVNIQARSRYHDFGRFLNALEYGDIAMTVEGFSITATNDYRWHNTDLMLNIIVYENK